MFSNNPSTKIPLLRTTSLLQGLTNHSESACSLYLAYLAYACPTDTSFGPAKYGA